LEINVDLTPIIEINVDLTPIVLAKKKAPSVRCLIQLKMLVGAIGLEPTTPTMSKNFPRGKASVK